MSYEDEYYRYQLKLIRSYQRRRTIWGILGCFGFLIFLNSFVFTWSLGVNWYNNGFGLWAIPMAVGVELLIWLGLMVASWTLDAIVPNPRVDR